MKILFNKSNDLVIANKEIKELLGWTNAELKFKNMESDIISASLELKKEIGKDTYNYFFNKYNEDGITQEEAEMLRLFRYAIVLKALLLFLPKNDVSITNNGRVMYRDDKTVSAFEHQNDKMDEALERDYYKSLDHLYDYLDDLNPNIIDEKHWKETSQYLKTQETFITSTSEFDEYFTINSRYLYQKLLPGIKQCVDFELKPRFNETIEQILSEKENKYYKLCQSACVSYAMNWGLSRLRANLFPKGILQNYKSDRNSVSATKVPEKMEAELAAQSFISDFRKIAQKIESELSKDSIVIDQNIASEITKINQKTNSKYVSL